MAEPTTGQRKMLAKMGLAMPDGSYYIRNGTVGASDLDNAIKAVGRGEADGGNGNDIRRHIMKRADALKLSAKIPDTWNPDGSLKHTDADIEAVLAHFGVRGMKWGVRKRRGSSSAPASTDSARATELHTRAKTGGTKTLSNEELQHLVTRLNLEGQYTKLSPDKIHPGLKIVNDVLVSVAKQQATSYTSKYAAKGIDELVKKAGG